MICKNVERSGQNGDHRMGDFLAKISLSSLHFCGTIADFIWCLDAKINKLL